MRVHVVELLPIDGANFESPSDEPELKVFLDHDSAVKWLNEHTDSVSEDFDRCERLGARYYLRFRPMEVQ